MTMRCIQSQSIAACAGAWRILTCRLFASCSLVLVFVMTLAGCSTTPDVEYDELPHFMYSPLSETGIIDRRAEFTQIFCDVLRSGIEPEYADQSCIDFLHIDQLPASPTVPSQIDTGRPMRVVFVPGFLGDCLQSHTTPFQNSRKLLEDAGFRTDLLIVGGRASSAHNAELIAAWLNTETTPLPLLAV